MAKNENPVDRMRKGYLRENGEPADKDKFEAFLLDYEEFLVVSGIDSKHLPPNRHPTGCTGCASALKMFDNYLVEKIKKNGTL